MKVIATQNCYIDNVFYKVGESFDVAEEFFSERSMVKEEEVSLPLSQAVDVSQGLGATSLQTEGLDTVI